MNIDDFVAIICFLNDNIEKFIDKDAYINVLKSSFYEAFKQDKQLYGKLIHQHCKNIIKIFE